jgi:hypothetical protein
MKKITIALIFCIALIIPFLSSGVISPKYWANSNETIMINANMQGLSYNGNNSLCTLYYSQISCYYRNGSLWHSGGVQGYNLHGLKTDINQTKVYSIFIPDPRMGLQIRLQAFNLSDYGRLVGTTDLTSKGILYPKAFTYNGTDFWIWNEGNDSPNNKTEIIHLNRTMDLAGEIAINKIVERNYTGMALDKNRGFYLLATDGIVDYYDRSGNKIDSNSINLTKIIGNIDAQDIISNSDLYPNKVTTDLWISSSDRGMYEITNNSIYHIRYYQ